MLALALGSAVGWTLFDFSRKRLGERLPAIPAVVLIMIAQTLVNLPLGGVDGLLSQSTQWYFLAALGVVVNAMANTLFVLSVQKAAFTLVIPLLALTPAFAALVGAVFLGESLGLLQVAAVLAIVVAALWLGWKGESRLLNRHERKALLMMTTTAFLWAVTPFLDRACTQEGGVSIYTYVAAQCAGVAVVLVGSSFLIRSFRAQFRDLDGVRFVFHKIWWRKTGVWVLLAAVAASIGLSLQIQGIADAHVGLFEAIKRSATMLLSLALGVLVLKESLTRAKVFVALIMIAGIFLLA
jgi:drug/metabolite transporter (DMT)-like permease